MAGISPPRRRTPACSAERFSLGLVAGAPLSRGMAGALVASTVRGATRAIAPHGGSPRELLEKTNSILWTNSAGSDGCGLFHAAIASGNGNCTFAAAGPMRVLAMRARDITPFDLPTIPLGLDSALSLREIQTSVGPGELLLAYSTAFLPHPGEDAIAALDERLTSCLAPSLELSAAKLIEIVLQILQTQPSRGPADHVALILKRRRR
jgi:serine phosphatase RsbU (regulator of sigma subunit)